MNKNIKKTNLTSDNSSFLRSVSKDTKEHFDSLLKKALHKNDKLKKEVNNLNRNIKKIDKAKSIEKDHNSEIEKDNYVNTNQSPEKGNFILEKFLLDAVNSKKEINGLPEHKKPEPARKLLNSVTFIKQPVPLPRSAKSKVKQYPSVLSRQGTYSISSPVLRNVDLLNDIEKLSTCSRNTYDVTDPKVIVTNVQNDDNHSDSSRGTYNIYNPDDKKQNTRTSSLKVSEIYINNTVPVGDIVIHNNSPKSKGLVKIVEKNKRQDSSSSENTSKTSAKSSKIHYESEKSKQRSEKSEKDKTSLECEQIEKYSKSNETEETNAGIELKDFIGETIVEHKIERKEKKKAKEHDDAETSFKEALFSYEDLIGVVVYKTDKLLLNSLINHPCVKIHVVDSETGEYLTRSKEIEEGDIFHTIKHIYPLITKSYKLQQNRSLIPYWEELMVFTEDFDYMLEYKESVIIFFEILDFLSFSAASMKYNKEGSNSGWHKVAWAFLKLVSKTGQLNTEQKIRLQLYKPKKTPIKKSATECILYDWWCKGSLTKYPSTLHVSVRRVKADSLKVTKHSDAIFKSELGLNIVEKDKDTREEEQDQETISNLLISQVKWSRMPNQSCKIPNKVQTKLKTARKGCFALKFSYNGLFLACGVADGEKYAILVYSVLDQQQEYCKLAGHQGIIYHLCWSSDDKYLISSSADCTVYIWNVFKKQYYPKQVLPHPAFVYCAQLNEELLHIITGCYDQVIRIWKSSAIDSKYELLQELDEHAGYITSLCFGENKNVLYSSDSVGIIIEWNYYNKEWILKRTLKIKDIQKTVINNIILHPGTNRMLVFCRDSTHRMIDLSVGCIIQWYRGALNYRVHTNGYLSPCGNLVFAPSEDGSIFVWNTDTGILLASYNPYTKMSKEIIIPHCIHYHPLDHIVAISHYGSSVPIFFCTFDSNATGSDLQFKLCTEKTEKQNVQENTKKVVRINNEKPNVKKPTKRDNNLSFDVIIDKIDDVLVSAKYD